MSIYEVKVVFQLRIPAESESSAKAVAEKIYEDYTPQFEIEVIETKKEIA